jgi:hypothetical protein
MPPGPGVNAFQINYRMTSEGLYYKLEVEWATFVKDWLIHNIEPWQITDRSRLCAIASNQLQVRELTRRVNNVREWLPSYDKLALSPKQSEELFLMLMAKTKKYMKLNTAWIKSYIDDHRQSSLGEGWRWNRAYSLEKSDWEGIFNIYMNNVEQMETHPGYSNQVKWNVGIRARSDEINEVDRYYDWRLMERSRIILFHPSMNMLTVFLPQKAAYYSEVLQETIDYLQAKPEYHYPYLEGGKIYTIAEDWHKDEIPFTAADGKTWDSSVGLLLGKAFRPWFIHVGGLDMLPTGTSVTSILDTMANIAATRNLEGKIIALGDDINYFGHKFNLKVPFIEISPEDTKHKYMLGVCYDPDIHAPRITGIKMTMDRARAMKPLPATFETEGSALVSRKRDARTRVAWAGLFKGQFGEGTLLESIKKMPASAHLAPTEYIEDMIENETGTTDVYAWAERAGVKTIFQ